MYMFFLQVDNLWVTTSVIHSTGNAGGDEDDDLLLDSGYFALNDRTVEHLLPNENEPHLAATKSVVRFQVSFIFPILLSTKITWFFCAGPSRVLFGAAARILAAVRVVHQRAHVARRTQGGAHRTRRKPAPEARGTLQLGCSLRSVTVFHIFYGSKLIC